MLHALALMLDGVAAAMQHAVAAMQHAVAGMLHGVAVTREALSRCCFHRLFHVLCKQA